MPRKQLKCLTSSYKCITSASQAAKVYHKCLTNSKSPSQVPHKQLKVHHKCLTSRRLKNTILLHVNDFLFKEALLFPLPPLFFLRYQQSSEHRIPIFYIEFLRNFSHLNRNLGWGGGGGNSFEANLNSLERERKNYRKTGRE